ncbi:hypothetical protein BGW80DRAFT_1497959 [Lactifluus volemus]|nr:hypothetical protein BGW80DRAFT_1497959 [Lactifluus volemus]
MSSGISTLSSNQPEAREVHSRVVGVNFVISAISIANSSLLVSSEYNAILILRRAHHNSRRPAQNQNRLAHSTLNHPRLPSPPPARESQADNDEIIETDLVSFPNFTLTLATPISPCSPIFPQSPTSAVLPFTRSTYLAEASLAPPTARAPNLPLYCLHTFCTLPPLETTSPQTSAKTSGEKAESDTASLLCAPRLLPSASTLTTRALYYALGIPLGDLDPSCVDWDVVESIRFMHHRHCGISTLSSLGRRVVQSHSGSRSNKNAAATIRGPRAARDSSVGSDIIASRPASVCHVFTKEVVKRGLKTVIIAARAVPPKEDVVITCQLAMSGSARIIGAMRTTSPRVRPTINRHRERVDACAGDGLLDNTAMGDWVSEFALAKLKKKQPSAMSIESAQNPSLVGIIRPAAVRCGKSERANPSGGAGLGMLHDLTGPLFPAPRHPWTA